MPRIPTETGGVEARCYTAVLNKILARHLNFYFQRSKPIADLGLDSALSAASFRLIKSPHGNKSTAPIYT